MGAYGRFAGKLLAAAVVIAASTVGDAVSAQQRSGVGRETGYPIPRFVSLKHDESRLRRGPGESYPIDWVYRRRGLPLEVISESGDWRKVRDVAGAVGWMKKTLIEGRRTAIVLSEDGGVAPRDEWHDLRAGAAYGEETTVSVQPGVIGRLVACEGGWCELEVEGWRGWIERRFLWGVYPGESLK